MVFFEGIIKQEAWGSHGIIWWYWKDRGEKETVCACAHVCVYTCHLNREKEEKKVTNNLKNVDKISTFKDQQFRQESFGWWVSSFKYRMRLLTSCSFE